MTNKKSTKRALLTSVLCLVLCVSMLVGTTFAWFTDSVSSGTNTIVAGNLDIEVYYAYPSDVVDGDIPAENWKRVEADTPVFNPDALWEPGYTEVVYFKVVNEGSLALEYRMNVDIVNETLGKTKDGADIKLSDHIQAYGIQSLYFSALESREEVTNPQGLPDYLNGVFSKSLAEAADGYGYNTYMNGYEENPYSLDSWQWLEPDETWYTTLVLFMPTTVGNEANHDGENVPSIDLGISVIATQYNWENEEDSFDHNYDENAWAEGMLVMDETELANALANGGNVVLGADIELTEAWTPVGTSEEPFTGVLDGNGHTISGLTVSAQYAALIAYTGENTTIRNLTLENVAINSTKYGAGVVCMAGSGLTLENITVSGTIDATSYAGGLVLDADKITIKNCVNNATVSSKRTAGIGAWITNATVENVVNNGNITGTIGAAGIAEAFSGTVKYATNNGTISSASIEPASGIVGIQKGVSTYEYCVNNGAVTSTANDANASAAGILGHTPGTKATLNYCINTGAITAEASYAAGIAYSLYGHVTANYCYNSGDVSGADGAGGITPKAQYGYGDKANYCVVDATVTSANGTAYAVCNNVNGSYYYDGETLRDSSAAEVTARAAKAALDEQTGGVFFKVVDGRLAASLDYNWEGDALVSTAAALQSALDSAEDGDTKIVLTGTVDLGGEIGATLIPANNATTTIVGGTIKGVGFDGELNSGVKVTSGSVVFDGVTFELDNEDIKISDWGMIANISGTANVTFKNCTFKGTQCPIYQSGANAVVTLENCTFESTIGMIQCEIYSGDFSLGQDLIIKNCDFTGMTDVLHIYDYDKDPSSEAIAQYLTDNGNTFTGVCKQTCK